MKKSVLAWGLTGIVVVSAILWMALRSRPSAQIAIDTPYQAVLLDNGQVYYAKINRLDSEFSVFTDVYYVEHQVDSQTKEVKNILIRRGNEWHAPNRTAVNTRHIVMIEPVTPGSKVAELIAALKNKGQ